MSQSQYYVTHYFNAQNAGSFMAVSLIGLIVVLAIVLLTAKLQKHYKINIENPTEVELAQIEQTHKTKVISWIESFYEMVFSSTSVLIFLSLYYVLDERIPQAAYYIILILLYIKFIYNDSNYDSLIFYFVMLAIGRFVYFDSTLDYIKESLKSVVKYLPLLILMGAYSGFICWYGFSSDFLLKSNGVIVSTLLAHLFMDVAIFVLDKIRVVQFIGKF